MTPETPLELVAPEQRSELLAVIEQNQIAPDAAVALGQSFAPFFAEARTIIEKSRGITVTDVSQVLDMKIARTYRLALRKVRTSADAARKVLQEDSRRRTLAINGFYNILIALTDGEETRLADQEAFALRKEEERKAALKLAREEQLRPFGLDTSFMNLGAMPDDAFAELLTGTRLAHEAKQAEARRVEEERARLENERLKESARIREENAKLKREAEEKEAALKAERERVAEENRIAAEKALAAAKEASRLLAEQEEAARQERLRLQALAEVARQKAAADAAEQERLRLEAIAAMEREHAAATRKRQEAAFAEAEAVRKKNQAAFKAQQEKTAKEQAARKKAEDDLAAQRAEAEERRRSAEAIAARLALAPDREKLTAYVANVRALAVPALTTDAGKAIAGNLSARLEAFAAFVEKLASTL